MLFLSVIVLVCACGESPTDPSAGMPPTTGTPGATPTGGIAGFVLTPSQNCIVGARVEIIDGPKAGSVVTQNVCGFWDYGDDNGFVFSGLPLDRPTTLRATATGYNSTDVRVTATNPWSWSIHITLTKEQ
jgi:hypothetical protein